jgi:hypothetical protein
LSAKFLGAGRGSRLRMTVVSTATPESWMLASTSATQAGTVQSSSITPTRSKGLFDVIAGYSGVGMVACVMVTAVADSGDRSHRMDWSRSVFMDGCELGVKPFASCEEEKKK